ncbi:uncharacterized protein LOC123501624 [Portunus trituberculatus]|uniref:uncharacterized protein LOC123501624 n=1 Tax=Portunus trituberculatus TaxID=210409 RepID=UPI001E1D0BBD|nr:uncharacterized protein LOC123501624 [Portunus trituberculatus]
MRGAVLTLAVVASCWTLAATTPTVGLGLGGLGLGIKPLIGLKVLGGLLGGFGGRHHKGLGLLHVLGKRSVDQQQQQAAAVDHEMLSMVAQLDPQGCLLKLLCHMETKEAEALSRHETILAGLFRDASDAATPSSAAFTYAVGIGSKSRDAAVCDKVFSKCPLKYAQLSSVLEESWTCPIGGALQN